MIEINWINALFKIGGFRARRYCAEQDTPSNQPNKRKWRIGVIAMAKHVQGKLNKVLPTSLVLIGWFSYILAISFVDMPLIPKIVFLSVARVLP